MAEGFNSRGTWGPRGRGFNMGTVQHDGHVIHLTGQVAWDENEAIVGKGDIEAQTRQCFRNILAVLGVVGGTVAGLGHEDFLVELTPVAVIPSERFISPGR